MTQTPQHTDFEGRLLAELLPAFDEFRSARPPAHSARRGNGRRIHGRGLLLAAALAAASVAASVGISELSSNGGPALASADVISRAAAAIDPAGVIMHTQVSVYGWNLCLGEEIPSRCFDSLATPAGGLSPDPSTAALSYEYQEWSSGGSTSHVIYNTGDEMATDGQTTQSYDPANNTLTTVNMSAAAAGSPTTTFPDVAALTPADIETLYAQAKAGDVQVQLGAGSSVNGHQVYELDFAGQNLSEQLFVDVQSFLPVKAIVSQRTAGGSIVSQVETVSAEALPATQANEALLTINSHTGAAQIALTQDQLASERGTAAVSVANGATAAVSASRRIRAVTAGPQR